MKTKKAQAAMEFLMTHFFATLRSAKTWTKRGLLSLQLNSPRTKKAQAAMEFLMTYGWAILVVLAAITALAYFGVLSPSKFFPETCTMPPTSGLACLDFKVTPDTAYMLMMNGGGRDLHIYNITIEGCQASFDMEMPDSKQYLFNVSGCDFGNIKERIKKDVDIVYSYQYSNLAKTAHGKLVAVIS